MNVLAVGCHPDDLEIGCGGTLAKLAAQGNHVTMVHVANGDKGHKVIMPDELIAIRKQEAQAAGALIGADVIGLGVPDLMVKGDNDALVNTLTTIIRQVCPDFIITHPTEDYMTDHTEVSKAVFSASFAASVPHYEAGIAAYDRIVPIYYMDSLAGVNSLPTDYVDISDYMDIKLRMNESHDSQIKWLKEHDRIDFLDFVTTIAKFRGYQCGKAYAEGFTQCLTWPRLVTSRILP
jgi:LmbE family N-acetylglucosaminyl deacetylase